jgi:hypothetical protein
LSEENNLSVIIKARIDAIQGIDNIRNELNNLNNLTDNINETPQQLKQVRQSPVYNEMLQGVDPNSHSNFQQQLQTPASLLMKDIAENTLDFQAHIEQRYGNGKLPESSWEARNKKARRFMNSAGEGMEEFIQNAQSELISGNLSEEEKSVRKAELEAIKSAFESLTEKMIQSFDKYFDKEKNVGKDPQLDPDKSGGGSMDSILALAKVVMSVSAINPIVQQAVRTHLTNYREGLVDEQIQARYKTAFSVNDMVSNYNQYRMAGFGELSDRESYRMDKVKNTGEETKNWATLAGTIIGGVVGSFVAPGAGTLTGAAIGGSLTNMVVGSLVNSSVGEQEIDKSQRLTKIQGELESKLKFYTELLSAVAPKVQVHQQYEIAGMRGMARIGSPGSYAKFGYMTLPAQVQEQLSFAESGSFYDDRVYNAQHNFAKAHGLDPSQVFGQNKNRWLLGSDTGARELLTAETYTKSVYGENVDAKKVLEVLDAIRRIQVDQLRYTVKADMNEALKLVNIPSALFGNANPYGRIDQYGGSTLEALGGILQPKSVATEAFVYQTLAAKFSDFNLQKYEEMKKGGINDPKNLPYFGALIQGTHETMGTMNGGKFQEFSMIESLFPNKLAGLSTKIADLFGNSNTAEIDVTGKDGKVIKQKITFEEFGKAVEDGSVNLEGLAKSADKAEGTIEKFDKILQKAASRMVSGAEGIQTQLSNQAAAIGSIWEGMIVDMQAKQNKYLLDISSNSKVFEEVSDILRWSTVLQTKRLFDEGLITAEGMNKRFQEMISGDPKYKSIINQVRKEMGESAMTGEEFIKLFNPQTTNDPDMKLAYLKNNLESFLSRAPKNTTMKKFDIESKIPNFNENNEKINILRRELYEQLRKKNIQLNYLNPFQNEIKIPGLDNYQERNIQASNGRNKIETLLEEISRGIQDQTKAKETAININITPKDHKEIWDMQTNTDSIYG